MRTVAIIQARMRSSRMPGKVLKSLCGRPVLWHIVHRLRKCRKVHAVAIATSTASADDAIETFARETGVEIVRGPEEDVLGRFRMAAERLQAEIIVRVTGDAPLVDPEWVDVLVGALVREGADYSVGEQNVPCIHEGFSPFTVRALEKLGREVGDDPVAREHVTAYFKEHPEFVPIAFVPIPPEYRFEGARVSVDTPADFRFLEEVYLRMNAPVGAIDVRDVVRLLHAEPELLEINSHVQRKRIGARSRRVLFRCDGDGQIGLGHVYRCLGLAGELRDRHCWGVSFAVVRGQEAFDLIQQSGYRLESRPDGPEALWLDSIIGRICPHVIVLDVRSDLERNDVEKWRRQGMLVVDLDDLSDRRLAADLTFYPPVPQVERMPWEGFTGERFVGWEWVVLRPGFAQPSRREPGDRPVVLVTMGGSDPAGMTANVLRALDMMGEDFSTTVVLGPGFADETALRRWIAGARRGYDVHRNVDDMPRLMNGADMAIASFGVTACELAALGVPALYLCLTEDHAESAAAFEAAGMGRSLGIGTEVAPPVLAQAVRRMLSDVEERAVMTERGPRLVDGRGAQRIAKILTERVDRTLDLADLESRTSSARTKAP